MNSSATFHGFLEFEKKVFSDSFPIAHYDPALIRYGEYRFVLDALTFEPAKTVLDLGCEANIFLLYLACTGSRVIGVDIDPKVWRLLEEKKNAVEKATGRPLDVTFKMDDATRLSLPSDSVDSVIAISSIEHMFSKNGHGDQMAIESIARVLRPGGVAAVTVPMSNGAPFHESPNGDKRFAGPYRLYTPETLQERLLSHPQLEIVRHGYLSNSTPDSRYPDMYFHQFWMNTLSAKERLKWAWAFPILAATFNPMVTRDDGHSRVHTLNTALICFRKRISL